AADFANALVRAYHQEDLRSRARAADRLTNELMSRLDQLRERLAASELEAETYRQENSLLSIDDKLVVDQQLTDAVRALGVIDERLAAMRARNAQLATADASTIFTLADGADQARLNTLIARQVAAQEEVARLSIRLGN